MINRAEERVTVRAWVASPEQAKTISDKQLQELQIVFNHQLGVEKRADGTVVLYSSDEATADRLAQIMVILCTFREQRVYVDDGQTATE